MANHVLSLAEAVKVYDGLSEEQRAKLEKFVVQESSWKIGQGDLRHEVIAVIRWEDWELILSI